MYTQASCEFTRVLYKRGSGGLQFGGPLLVFSTNVGKLSKSGRQHFVLEGDAPNGARGTAIAAAYPPAFQLPLPALPVNILWERLGLMMPPAGAKTRD